MLLVTLLNKVFTTVLLETIINLYSKKKQMIKDKITIIGSIKLYFLVLLYKFSV